MAYITQENEKDPILACQDGVLRIIQDSKLFLEIPLGSPVTAISNLHFDTPGRLRSSKDPVGVIFGLENGKLGVVRIEKSLLGSNREAAASIIWVISDEKKSPVTAIAVYDLSQEKGTDIIVGRDDGRVEVYTTGSDSGEGGNFTQPYIVFSHDLQERLLLLTL